MSEPGNENLTRELRSTAPPAPERLRERVRALPAPSTRTAWRLRPALVMAVAIAVAVAVGAAAIGGLRNSAAPEQRSLAGEAAGAATPSKPGDLRAPQQARAHGKQDSQSLGSALAIPAPGSRLQQYDVSMSLRVRDLSRATQAAVRQTRRLGGYVAAANYSTGVSVGDSSLELRVPVGRIQAAIARFTDLGTILSQRISVADLQAPLDRTDARIAALQKVISELETKNFRTPAEQTRLDGAKRTLQRLSQSRTNLVREGTYAKISLQLTTRKAAAKHTEPGRFDRFWGDAGDILGKEAIAVLYTLVVAGPFAILAALALLAERARRRRADHRLLGETG
jgi:hypothetical protein